MSVNLANIRMLRALSKALDREAGHQQKIAGDMLADGRTEAFQIAGTAREVLRGLCSACNEAAEDLNQQDLDAIERMKG